ncbi:MAG: porin [Burkholderiales bacterium]|nr:porin [Burkholderiales bacterium]OJX06119.1 MAG: hypothetical protein BGO72_03670 [Burkholderiales bacterium 70-64]
MKKSLLAVAVAAALPAAAFAQTNVTLSGIVKGGLAFTKYSNGAAGNDSGTSLDDGSSRFIISGSEDLGGGMRGIFMIDTRFRVEEGGGTLASGNTFVGLAGNWGSFRMGRLDTYYGFGTDEHGARATALQASNISILSWVGSVGVPAIAAATRINNVLRYDLPAMGGFSGGLTYSSNPFGNDGLLGDPAKGQAWSADLAYRGGPFVVGAAYWDAKFEGSPPSGDGQKSWRLYGSWDFGVAKVGLTFDQSKVMSGGAGGDAKRGAWSIPVTAKLGPGTVLLTYSQARDVDSSVAGKLGDTGAKMYSLGYDYPLSKRTSLGVSYAVLNNDTNANYAMFTSAALGGHPVPTAGQDQKQLYLGIRHTF